jgi:chromosome segregation ATPase
MQTQLEEANACIVELEDDAGAALGRIQTLEQQLEDADAKYRKAHADALDAEDRIKEAEAEAERGTRLAKQMEDALGVAEDKLAADDDKIAELKATITTLERDSHRDRSLSRMDADRGAEIDALEAELDDAHREIAKLTTQLAQSPARKAIDQAKDAKIEMLEREREELLERVKSLKNASMSFQTPGKRFSTSGISPAHRHVLNMTLRTPKTPGGPLREVRASILCTLSSGC